MSKKSKQKGKGGAKSYSAQPRKGGAVKSYQQPGPTAQRVMQVRLAGIAVMVAAAASALALAIPYGGQYPVGILISLIVLGFITGLGLFAAVRAPVLAQRLDAARAARASNAARKR